MTSLLWPHVDSVPSAEAAARRGALGCVLFALYCLGLAFFLWTEDRAQALGVRMLSLEAVIFVVLAIGSWKLSRVAAVGAFVLFVLEQLTALLRDGVMIGAIPAVAIALLLAAGARGAFANRRLMVNAAAGIRRA